VLLLPEEPVCGQFTSDPLVLDCDPELVWLPVDVVVAVVLLAANAIPTDESAATIDMARIEYASMPLFFLS
jgi:hypothetical protein